MDEREPPEIDADPNSYRDREPFRSEPIFHPGAWRIVLQFVLTLAILGGVAYVARAVFSHLF